MEPILLKPPIDLPLIEEPVLLPAIDPPARVLPSDETLPAWTEDISAPPESESARTTEFLTPEGGAVFVATTDESLSPANPSEPRPGLFRRVGRGIASGMGWLFGSLTLIVGLAFLASYPIVQFFSLGYLLEAAGRIGRTGKLRDAFPMVRLASRLGGMLLGAWLLILPWRFTSDLLVDSELIDPASPQTAFIRGLLVFLTVFTPLHILFAVSRGGRLRYFLWPFNLVWFAKRLWRGGYFRESWTNCVTVVRELRVWHFFSLGLRGYLGAAVWLVIPSTLYAFGRTQQTALLGIIGGILLAVVVFYVPFLQVRFAAEDRWRAMFEVRAVRERFRHAPIAFLIAFVFTLLLVLPLYLLKIEVVPRDALWLPSLLFIVTIFPLKVMTGWAYGRAGRREKQAHFMTRFACRFLMLPVAVFYAIFVFLTQYFGWHGVQALYEHHAFLLPVAF